MSLDVIPNDYTIVDYNNKPLNKSGIKECIEKLKNLVLDDSLLKNVRNDDDYLSRFLFHTNFDVSTAFKKMGEFHKLVKNNPDWFIPISPSERVKHLQYNAKVMLPFKDLEGRSVYFVQLGKVDASFSNPKMELQLDEIWFESVLNQLETLSKGVSIIVDMSGYSIKLFRWFSLGNVKVTTQALQLCPCKELVFHIVNTSFLLNASVRIVWPFLGARLKEQVKFHSNNWENLHKYFRKADLPPEYGGTGPKVNFESLIGSLLEQDNTIRKNLEYRLKI